VAADRRPGFDSRRYQSLDRPCGLVVRLPGCRHRSHGFNSWRYQRLDRPCGLVVGVPHCRQRSRIRFPALPEFRSPLWSSGSDFLAADTEVTGSIPGATRLSTASVVYWSDFLTANRGPGFDSRHYQSLDRPCDLVVRLPGCRHRGPGFDSQRFQIF
jgi:hypothetical protein